MPNKDYYVMLCIVILNDLLDILETDFLHAGYGYLRFYPWIEIFYYSCYLTQAVTSGLYICCIRTNAHGLQVTSSCEAY